ncbi:hypothetical protein [Halioxenophilus sp. WMMB6]|uniref:hypothetical protein n=1 Tax=Halioxenophilus sp. WMMB6 TaxID=3073815 RepID=UPI00295F1178|nr:hypothetical protein [Halioxenophilus sp. WMMB6]
MINRICFLLAFAFTSVTQASSFEEAMIFPGQFVDGKSLSEYADMWWQWTYTMSPDLSPVRDLTGKNCHQEQSGDVWFLAGGYGSSKIRRTCEVPSGKYVFFPVINMIYYPRNPGSVSCDDVKESAALNNDNLLNIDVTLDLMHASNPAHTRLKSEECFDLLGLLPSSVNAPKIYPTASDGYWIMLKPLSKGKHNLKFRARYDGDEDRYSKMVRDIEYELIVK